MTKRPLNPDEQRAWARVARSVKSLHPEGTAEDTAKADMKEVFEALLPAPGPSTALARTQLAQKPSNKAPLANRKNEKRIRRGQAQIAARFDLHGHTQASADAALPAFLIRQRANGARCVLIITGKGQRGEGVLRRNFLHWLETPAARITVSGYAEAHRKHGGAGAFYVFLRRLDTK